MENINKQRLVGIVIYLIGIFAVVFQISGCFTKMWLQYEITLRQPGSFGTHTVTTISVSIGLWAIRVCTSVSGGFYLSTASENGCGSATIEELNKALATSTEISDTSKGDIRELLESFTPQKILTVSGGVLGIIGFILTYAYVRIKTKETRASMLVSGVSCLLAWLASGIEECPYNIPADMWINNPTKWPDVQWPDVYHYLIETPGVYTKSSMKNYKSLEAHNFFISGWVQTVAHINIKGTPNILLKASVKPSFRVNEEPHQAWVAISKDGDIISAHCDCKAGLGESCSHVAAMLFKIEAAVRNGYTKQACTEQPCAWNKCFTKNVEPAPMCDIKFYKDSAKQRLNNSKRKRKPPPPPTSMDKQKSFLKSLTDSAIKPVGLSIFKETAHVWKSSAPVSVDHHLPKPLSSLYNDSYKDLTSQELESKYDNIICNLDATVEECQYLKDSTVNQSNSVTWHEQRVGRITASVAYDVLHTRIEKPAPSLIKKICYQNQKQINVPSLMWGRENESKALGQYKLTMSTQHDNLKVEKSGLGLIPKKPYIGASPDGIVACSCCGTGVVEIKCPYSLKEKNIEEMLQMKDFCLDKNYQLKENSKYYTQVQLQMLVFDCTYCHFIIWSTNACIITYVARNSQYLEEIMPKLDLFWKMNCLPELMTHKMVSAEEMKENKPIYCYCQKPWNSNDGTDMVGCDAVECPYKWIHYECAKMKRPPKGKWYCKHCKKTKK